MTEQTLVEAYELVFRSPQASRVAEEVRKWMHRPLITENEDGSVTIE